MSLVLVDDQGNDDLQSTAAISWNNLTEIADEMYQVEWTIDLQDNVHYQLLVISHSLIGQTISDPFMISMAHK